MLGDMEGSFSRNTAMVLKMDSLAQAGSKGYGQMEMSMTRIEIRRESKLHLYVFFSIVDMTWNTTGTIGGFEECSTQLLKWSGGHHRLLITTH